MVKASDNFGNKQGFSLAEVLVAMMIGAMLLVAVLAIYSRFECSAAALSKKLGSSQLSFEVLQRITEDINRIAGSSSDTKLSVENKFDNGFPVYRLTILKTFYDSKDAIKPFEKVIWQSGYDYDGVADGLVLYRSHSGVAAEDKLLDEQKEDWERELFVPICAGITCFRVQVPVGENLVDTWTADSLPTGLVFTISFAPAFQTVGGSMDVPEEEKVFRTTLIDRTKKSKFVIEDANDSNSPPLKDGQEKAYQQDTTKEKK